MQVFRVTLGFQGSDSNQGIYLINTWESSTLKHAGSDSWSWAQGLCILKMFSWSSDVLRI